MSCVTGLQQCLFTLLCCMAATKLLLLSSAHRLHSPTWRVMWEEGGRFVMFSLLKLSFPLWRGIPKVGANIPSWNLNFLILFHFLNIILCPFSLISWFGFSPVTVKSFARKSSNRCGFCQPFSISPTSPLELFCLWDVGSYNTNYVVVFME